MKEIIKILTDPASNRLIQLIRTKGKMTIADILSESPDVPRATVYRKIEKMLNADVIEIIDSHKVRGQIENVYAIKNIYLSPPKDNADGMEIMKLTLMQLFGLCDNYFKSDDADVERDKLFVLNYAISLSDNDFADMLAEMFSILEKYQNKEVTMDSKLRNMYLMSMPKGEKLK